jgi:hypothetical protein
MAGVFLPELVEALVLRRAVELARDEGLEKVIFESDCLFLVQRMNSTVMDMSLVGITTSEIKHMSRCFQSVSFRHVKRVFNEAAHRLAKSSEDVNSSLIILSVPDFIRETLCIGVFLINKALFCQKEKNTHTRYTTGPNQSGCQTPTAPRCGAAQSALFFLAASGKLPSRRGWTMAPPFMYWRPADGEETRTTSLHRPLPPPTLPPRPIAHTLCSFPSLLPSVVFLMAIVRASLQVRRLSCGRPATATSPSSKVVFPLLLTRF